MHENVLRDFLGEHYALDAVHIELLSHSSKMVYKLSDPKKEEYIFDIYSPREQEDTTANDENRTYGTLEAVASEARILQIVSEKCPELKSPCPLRNTDGQLLSSMTVNGTSFPCLLRTFIVGNELVKGSQQYARQVYQAGRVAARFHHFSTWHLQNEYHHRPVHRQDYVRNILQTLGRGIDAGTITRAQYALVKKALEFVIQRMGELDHHPNSLGIVHTDLRDANLLVDGENVIPIDFGRCVYGYLLYDLGEMCAHMAGDDSDIPVQIIKGYHSIRKLTPDDIVSVEAFQVLFILSVLAEFILQKDNSYVLKTLERLTKTDLVHLLEGEPVIPHIRSAID